LVRRPHAEFHGAPAIRHLECARRGEDRHAERLLGLLHDTNQRNLFSDDYRFDSHGCSRVDNVRDLAAWLLQEEMPKWNRAAIDAAIATGQRQDIPLPRKVPVAWIYLTAWMTKDQTVQFRNDIYDQDQQLLEATAEEAAFFSQAANHPLTAHLAQ
jgi:murein L,D-transpeptidase YcbB/YkuD